MSDDAAGTKATATKWQMLRSEEPIEIPEDSRPTKHGDPAMYKFAQLPDLNDDGWELAPLDSDGKLNFKMKSRLPGGYPGGRWKNLDFTFFRTVVEVPEGEPITEFRVTIGKVDDGARMYLYNSSHLGGTYKEADDAKLSGQAVSADFKDEAIAGTNVVMVVQFDDSPTENNLTGGIEVKVNGVVVTPGPETPKKPLVLVPARFEMETYGVSGTRDESDIHWAGWNANAGKPGIVSKKNDSPDSYVFEIEREEQGDKVALKVTNYHGAQDGKSHYLPDLGTTPTVYEIAPPLKARDLTTDHEYNFVSYKADGVDDKGRPLYLRHRGKVLYDEGGSLGHDVYIKDCTWRLHSLDKDEAPAA